ncbi:MAG TPA: hypothetical protein VGR28_02565 [Candidatus Thermoplasmatota archaeon]|jgi:hypothetical protein|nr:hypothetical protein [Candidatus Thermoplasmatota archaeon]
MAHLFKLASLMFVSAIALGAGMANAQTAAYGVLSLFFPNCPADTVIAVGFNDGSFWNWAMVDANTDPTCVSVDADIYVGPDPFVGGCGGGTFGGQLCLTGPTVDGSTIHYTNVKVCYNDAIFSFCVNGSGDLNLLG